MVFLKKILDTEKKYETADEIIEAEKKPEYTTEELEKLNTWIIEKKQIPTKPEIMSILKLSRYEVNKRGMTELRKKLKLTRYIEITLEISINLFILLFLKVVYHFRNFTQLFLKVVYHFRNFTQLFLKVVYHFRNFTQLFLKVVYHFRNFTQLFLKVVYIEITLEILHNFF